ncbi:hypothetical protein C7S18_13245 [Ahniella affigens]|uniref:Uncharacterized protein n=1 Tax=Ahniella affigens TaxID=2021234 RepID=A0A2P1PTD3_9GAMM|nr:hypothetical protein [Ahniella affigens]AVP98104.1 hypothetical protein C7S18_13245 [Ahniella affigens]
MSASESAAARYNFVDMSPRYLPALLVAQLLPGSFAPATDHLRDALDLSGFDPRDRNDLTGAPRMRRRSC